MTAVVLLFLLKLPAQAENEKRSFFEVFKSLDPAGTAIFVPAIVCLLLALQWGGIQYEWSNGRIIALFIIFGLALIAFVAIQIIWKDNATGKPCLHY